MTKDNFRSLVKWFVWAALSFAVLGLSLALHSQLPVGRRALGDIAEHWVSIDARGRLELSGIKRLNPWSVEVERVRMLNEESEAEMEIEDVNLDLNPAELLRGRLVAIAGTCGPGVVRLTEKKNGDLGIETVFLAPLEKIKSVRDISAWGWLDLKNIAFTDIDGKLDLHKLPDVHFDKVKGIARVRVDERSRLRLEFADTSTKLRLAVLGGIEGEVREIEGQVNGEFRKVVDMRGFAKILGLSSPMRINYLNQKQNPRIVVAFDTSNPKEDIIVAAGKVFGFFKPALEIRWMKEKEDKQ